MLSGVRDSFSGDLECCSVIGTRAWEWQAECRVHAVMKRIQLQRNQTLIVIHAKHGVEFAVGRAMKDCVRRMRARKDEVSSFRVTVIEFSSRQRAR